MPATPLRIGTPAMPIYEFACPKCRRIYSFLSKRIHQERLPVCPKCGNRELIKQMSGFAMIKGVAEPAPSAGEFGPDGDPMPEVDDARMERVMSELERDMGHLDENNPRHVAHMMKKMKEILPPGTVPKDLDVAIRRLEQGEDPEKVEADMGDVLGDLMGGGEGGDEDEGGGRGMGRGGYSRDSGLYDY
jgi:putative FmdB family regulatory protein